MNDDLYYLNRFTGTDIVVDESDKGVVEKLNWTCASIQAANPTPDAPKTIYSSGDGGKIVMWSHKKNMFDKATIATGDIKNLNPTIRLCSRQNIWLKAGTYTFSTNMPSPLRWSLTINQVGYPPLADYPTYSLDTSWQTLSTYTFTITTAGYCVLQFSKVSNAALTVAEVIAYTFQLETGNTATSYEPYTGSTTDITTPVGYIGGSLPNGVQDSDTQKKIGKVVLKGISTLTGIAAVTTDTNCISFYAIGYKTYPNNDTINCLCDKFKAVTRTQAGSITGECIGISSTGAVFITILKSRLTGYSDGLTNAQKIALMQTWLTNNDTTMYYELATPETIIITKPPVSTYEGINYITTTNNIKPTMSIEAWKR